MIPAREMEIAGNYINKLYGIKLNWSEKVALSLYVTSTRERGETRPLQAYGLLEYSVFLFMRDYFGLDALELGHRPGTFIFLGDERFKECCRRNVDFWRDERTLL
jgi:hypothetical protein